MCDQETRINYLGERRDILSRVLQLEDGSVNSSWGACCTFRGGVCMDGGLEGEL
jgi:hypothetical protein